MESGRDVIPRAARLWAPLAVAATLVAALAYGAVQQGLRSSADSPQVQMARSAASRLDAGLSPAAVVPAGTVDMRSSLDPYTIVFDRAGRPLSSSAQLAGYIPRPPPGMFANATPGGEDRVTWQPAPGVRGAAVIVPYRNGFVLSGRSLKIVEQRESALAAVALAGWVAALVAMALAALGAALSAVRVDRALLTVAPPF